MRADAAPRLVQRIRKTAIACILRQPRGFRKVSHATWYFPAGFPAAEGDRPLEANCRTSQAGQILLGEGGIKRPLGGLEIDVFAELGSLPGAGFAIHARILPLD